MSRRQILFIVALIIIVAAALTFFYETQQADLAERSLAIHDKAIDNLAAVEAT